MTIYVKTMNGKTISVIGKITAVVISEEDKKVIDPARHNRPSVFKWIFMIVSSSRLSFSPLIHQFFLSIFQFFSSDLLSVSHKSLLWQSVVVWFRHLSFFSFFRLPLFLPVFFCIMCVYLISHFGSRHFGSRIGVNFVTSGVVSFLPLVRRHVMPRRGWSTMEVPDGWLQLIRGPCPESEEVDSQDTTSPSEAGTSSSSAWCAGEQGTKSF